jgi:phage tail-like protein
MSCGPLGHTFRLLDGYVGWEAVPGAVTQLQGFGEGEALELALDEPDALDPGALLAWLPPSRLARGCGGCERYLVTSGDDGRVLTHRCSDGWAPIAGVFGRVGALRNGVALAVRGHLLAVADHDAGRVWVLGASGEQILATIEIVGPRAVALTPWGELLVAVDGGAHLLRYDRGGIPLGALAAAVPAEPVDRLAIGSDCNVYLVTNDGRALRLYRAAHDAHAFERATLATLADAFEASGVLAADPDVGFCLREPGRDGLPVDRCWDWSGDALPAGAVAPPPPPPRARVGQLLTVALDSGFPRTRWHRVRIDAEVPPKTRLWADVASSEDPDPPNQGDPSVDPEWSAFDPGTLHPTDWQVTKADAPLDFLVRQPPGRYLFVRLRFKGDGKATPSVRRIRIDLPRSTSLERLPAVFRETPEAEDFTERFLSLFDATIEQIDRAIERVPALLDTDGVPDDVLPWLGSFLDIVFDPVWTPRQRRDLLRQAPQLYRKRGTRAGLVDPFRALTGSEPTILELFASRAWGAVARTARVGSVRLFSRADARFRLGGSRLGAAPIRSFGNPDQDPHGVEAFRLSVLLPPSAVGSDPQARERLVQLVARLKPAHTVASLRLGAGAFVVGTTAAVGVDTVLGGLPEPVLGTNARLSRTSVLGPPRAGRRAGLTIGAAVLGPQAVVA